MTNELINELRELLGAWGIGLTDQQVIARVTIIVTNWTGKDVSSLTTQELVNTYRYLIEEAHSHT